MSWFDKLERKYGKYAIKNLMFYIIALYAFGFIIEVFYPEVYSNYLSLNAEAILHGQIWRVVTFIIQPPSTSFFWIFFSLYMYYMIGTVLENVWGSFRFNVYFFMGVILNVLAAIIIYLIFGINMELSTYYINLALFMAFAMIAPNVSVLLFFIIPIKIKWIAYFDGIYLALTVIFGYLSPILPKAIIQGLLNLGILSYGTSIGNVIPMSQIIEASYINATAALVSMINYLVFWFMVRRSRTTPGQKAFKKAMNANRKGFSTVKSGGESSNAENKESQKGVMPQMRFNAKVARHSCAICHRTELDDENLEFRFCSKCEGNFEYCNEHLYSHIHVKL